MRPPQAELLRKPSVLDTREPGEEYSLSTVRRQLLVDVASAHFDRLGAAGGANKFEPFFKRDELFQRWSKNALRSLDLATVPAKTVERANTYTIQRSGQPDITVVGVRIRHYDIDELDRALDNNSTPITNTNASNVGTIPEQDRRRIDILSQVALDRQGNVIGIHNCFLFYEPERGYIKVSSDAGTNSASGISGVATALEAATIHQLRQIAGESDAPGNHLRETLVDINADFIRKAFDDADNALNPQQDPIIGGQLQQEFNIFIKPQRDAWLALYQPGFGAAGYKGNSLRDFDPLAITTPEASHNVVLDLTQGRQMLQPLLNDANPTTVTDQGVQTAPFMSVDDVRARLQTV